MTKKNNCGLVKGTWLTLHIKSDEDACNKFKNKVSIFFVLEGSTFKVLHSRCIFPCNYWHVNQSFWSCWLGVRIFTHTMLWKSRPFILSNPDGFFRAFALRTKALISRDGCAEWRTCPFPTVSRSLQSHHCLFWEEFQILADQKLFITENYVILNKRNIPTR